ncbi:porin [Scleromatobacter humisilvae]|uniref:Porin n=1 Tax=Scleromatobacter humisilvae TaxID=2897159 RepID=A0A9X1YPC5_9BURK|nr:porin [Scleromatobacter humisilvae]MCK9685341.1 porin [Scleromatobacter humisilvae]
MKELKLGRSSPLVVAACMAACMPAWSQDNGAATSNQDVLKRLEEMARQIEQLKAQVKADEEKLNATARSAAPQPVAAPVGKAAVEGLSKQGNEEATGAVDVDKEPEGAALVRSEKAKINFYGMIDVGVEDLRGHLASGKESDAVRISNGIITPHFGLIGNGQLVRGLQGSFNMEGSFAPDNGSSGIGGRLFGRQAWVGLSGGFGTVRLGRQYTMARMGWEDANPYGTGNQGLRLLDPRISNPRADNSISYFGKWGPVTAGVNWSAGWDAIDGNAANTGPSNNAGADCPGEVASNNRQCRESSAGIKYDGGSWGLTSSFERLWGGTSATYGGLTTPNTTDTRFVLGGYLKLHGGAKLTAGWIQRDNEGSKTPKSDMYWTQAIVPVGDGFYFDGLLGELKYEDSPNKAMLINLRGRYIVSKDTTLYVTGALMNNDGTLALPASASTPSATPSAGGKQGSVITGILYRF